MTNNPSSGIGSRLARYRRIAGYSAQRLSDVTDGRISRGTIARIESGVKLDVTVDELIVLSMALGISPIALALPLEDPFTDVPFWDGGKVTVAELAQWFKDGTIELHIPTDDEGDTEDMYGTAATVVAQDIIDGVLEYNTYTHTPLFPKLSAEDEAKQKVEREKLRSRLTMLGVDLSIFEKYE
jgi:transcriptional regulator with XRE-family HTH domain